MMVWATFWEVSSPRRSLEAPTEHGPEAHSRQALLTLQDFQKSIQGLAASAKRDASLVLQIHLPGKFWNRAMVVRQVIGTGLNIIKALQITPSTRVGVIRFANPAARNHPGHEMDLATKIHSYKKVVDYFGAWPSFHDFEVISMTFQRGEVVNGDAPSLEAEFFAFRLEVAPDHPERKNSKLRIRFEGLQEVVLTGFNHQNAVLGLELSRPGPPDTQGFRVVIKEGFGVQCEFQCERIEVVSISPCPNVG